MVAATSTTYLAHMTTAEIEAIDKSNAVVVQPIGAIEQHGPHLPIITDALCAERITTIALSLLPAGSNVYQLPVISYGKSNEHLGRAGTIAMSATTLMGVCMDVGRSLAASGFKKLVFLNGHGGQPGLLDMMSRDIRIDTGLEVFPVSPSGLGRPAGIECVDPGWGIHGGQMETSVVLALAPELVKMEFAKADGQAAGSVFASMKHLTLEGKVPTAWVTDDLSATGTLGDPSVASAEIGKAIVEHQTKILAEVLLEIRDFAFPAIPGLKSKSKANGVANGAH